MGFKSFSNAVKRSTGEIYLDIGKDFLLQLEGSGSTAPEWVSPPDRMQTDNTALFTEVIVLCSYCGQWAAVKTECGHCGAAVAG